jgi:DinB superfamily
MNLNEMVTAYEQSTQRYLDVVESLSSEDLDKSKTGGWTPRQIIHHVADSEAQSYARLRRLIAEPGSEIQGYDEGGWGENETLGYRVLPIDNSVAVTMTVRTASADILKRITEAQLSNACIHSESGPFTLQRWIEVYSKHPVEHANQIISEL